MKSTSMIQLKGISKSFGEVRANDCVDMDIYRGEVLALLGENGSGKSTLMNILSGIYAPDAGQIIIDGKPVNFRSPEDSASHGIGMIHQHFKLAEALTVMENISAGAQRSFMINPKTQRAEINELCKRYGLTVDPDKYVFELSVSEKQTVELLKALYRGAAALILDEPTAVLTPQEIKSLFDILRTMRANGCAIVIITHKLDEVMSISDRVAVLRKGKNVGCVNTAETDASELTRLMVGHAVSLDVERSVFGGKREPLVRVKNLTMRGKGKRNVLDNLSFEIERGEILGVAGVAGSGQRELCEALTGMSQIKSGEVWLGNENIANLSPRNRMKKGIKLGFVPEDRLGMGLAGGMSVSDNVILMNYRDHKGMFIDKKESRQKAENLVKKYDVSTPGVAQIISRLSGGNIQKILMGRELENKPEFLITSYPVRGLDIGASRFMYDRLNDERARGTGVLFIGEDLDILIGLCDRIMVMQGGNIVGCVDAKTTTREEIGLMMTGKEVKRDA